MGIIICMEKSNEKAQTNEELQRRIDAWHDLCRAFPGLAEGQESESYTHEIKRLREMTAENIYQILHLQDQDPHAAFEFPYNEKLRGMKGFHYMLFLRESSKRAQRELLLRKSSQDTIRGTLLSVRMDVPTSASTVPSIQLLPNEKKEKLPPWKRVWNAICWWRQ
jgi:hypothetical protein